LKNLVETAIEAGNFKTLIKAIQEAGLFDTLSSDGPFTLFAPTDEAFSKLPAGVLDDIINDKERLTNLLTNHIIQDQVLADRVTNLKNIDNVNGKKISIKTSKNIKIDNAEIIKTNIKCTNGVIHIIDRVLLPKNN
jgi:uncharacterized surface protein with fasciclin (FAS1) repeats